MAQQIYHRSPSLYRHIRENMQLLFLPDQRIILNAEQRKIVQMDEVTRTTSLCHLAILNQFSAQVKNNYDKVMALHVDEINIQPNLVFQNKHLILGAAHNHPSKLTHGTR